MALLVAGSAHRLRQITAQGRLAKRLERLEIAARSMGAERRMGPRMPHACRAIIRLDGIEHATASIDLGHQGVMLERPPALLTLGNTEATVRLEAIGTFPAKLVALDVQTLSLKLLQPREPAAAERLSALMQQLDRDNAAILETARRFADDLTGAFTEALASRRLTQAMLFSNELSPIAGTSPQQFTHPALGFFEHVLPPIAARYYAPDKGVAYAVATDRNCYVPVHHPAYQQPQRPDDPRFSHSFSRHRRIYDDRWTLRAARFSPWPVVQAYRRDMPRGFGELVRDVSAPVIVLGRRWGAAQIAYSLDLDD
jgi:methyl-accepting chemotaxis protein